jgi:hypothetical protein
VVEFTEAGTDLPVAARRRGTTAVPGATLRHQPRHTATGMRRPRRMGLLTGLTWPNGHFAFAGPIMA